MIYDNSPQSHRNQALQGFGRFTYIHDPTNGGTRAAYHSALERALAAGCQWILLLDHDTALPADFLETSSDALLAARSRRLGALVPMVRAHGSVVSPAVIGHYGKVTPLVSGHNSAAQGLTAISSAALVRTEVLAKLAPIPACFALDYLDHWMFRSLAERGYSVAVSAAEVSHSLSSHDMRSLSSMRLASILAAELQFLRGSSKYSAASYLVWHILRTVRIAVTTKRWALMRVCFLHINAIVMDRWFPWRTHQYL